MIPEGWEYEPADYSVGIMADGWYHAACPNDSDDFEATLTEIAVVFKGAGMNRVAITTYALACPCGATAAVNRTDYDPDDA